MRRLMVASLLCVAASAQDSRPASATTRPGTRLLFRVDLPLAIERGQVRRDEVPQDVVREVAAVVRQRLDRSASKGISVEQTGLSVTVLAPALPPEEVEALVRLVSIQGSVEMRMVADDQYRVGDVTFDLFKERERLQAWLAVKENRDAVQADPLAIARFNAGAGTEAGPVCRFLRWCPLDRRARFYVPGTVRSADGDANAPGFVPLNLHDVGFTQRDVEFRGLDRSEQDEAVLSYAVVAERRQAYVDLSARSIGKAKAIVCDGKVVVAPVFRTRIAAQGALVLPGFSEDEARTLLAAVRGGALRAPLTLVTREAGPRR